MQAAKEETSFRSEASCRFEHPSPALPLAALPELAENSHQGFTTKKRNSPPAWSEVNFQTATEIGASLRRNGTRSRCQSLNRYAYALNNPTTLTDPSGLGPLGCPQGMPTEECYGGVPGFWSTGGPLGGPSFTFSSPTWNSLNTVFSPTYMTGENGDYTLAGGGLDPNGLALLSLNTGCHRNLLDFRETFYQKYGQKLNDCIAKVFGNDSLKVPLQTFDNSPAINASLSEAELGARSSFAAINGENTGLAWGSNAAFSGPHGLVYIAREAFRSPQADLVPRTYAHELGNILDARTNYRGNPADYELTYGNPNDPQDMDTGQAIENCLFP